jgi:lysozyme
MTVRFDEALLLEHVKDAEGFRSYPYRCSANKLTIGYGRNLQDNGISKVEGNFLLISDVSDAIADAERLDFFADLDPVRQMVIVDMLFNLGWVRFCGFKKFAVALRLKDYTLAAHEMQDSKWYRQVGRRAKKLQKAMVTGVWE